MGLDPCRIELERTDSTLMIDPEKSPGDLKLLRNTGVSVVIDNF